MNIKPSKKIILGTLLILLTATILVACGDATATPGTVATTAAGSSTTAAASGSNSTSPAGSNATGTTGAAGANPGGPANGAGQGQGRGQGMFNVTTGTVQSYDAASKSLTVAETNGATQTFDATNAVISKSAKITLADLGKETLSSQIVQVTGTKASDGSYTATALTLADPNMMGNGGFAGGRGGANGATGGATGTPGANAASGTPGQATGRQGAGDNGTPGANGAPAGGFGGGAGANGGNRLMLRNATLSGNTLTGTDQTGASVTVNLSDSTTITKRTADTATDLAAGAKISVNFRAAQSKGTAAAVAITIEQ